MSAQDQTMTNAAPDNIVSSNTSSAPMDLDDARRCGEHKQLARGELIPELKSVLCEVDLDPSILEKAVLQAPPESVEVWPAEYQRRLVEGDAPYLQEQVRAAYTCLTKDKAAASSTWLGDARSMRAYYLLELWVHRRGVCGYTTTFERMRDVLREMYKTAHAVSRIGVYFEYKSFEDARDYVRTLGLKSTAEWWVWRKSGARPHDIPSAPQTMYASSGWTSYGDFLGYAVGKVAGEFRSFEEARAYVHTLGLKSRDAWREWISSGAQPHDIPANPDVTYALSGWLSYGDFLGFAVGKVAGSFRTFEEARTYVRTLGLKSAREWFALRKTSARPPDIPSAPNVTYKSSGWTSYGDFLGYAEGQGARGSCRSFEDARAYVRTLGLKGERGWRAWSSSGKRPHDIPGRPETAYKSSGWTSWGAFLGCKMRKQAEKPKESNFRSFEDARTYARTLGLKSVTEWEALSKSGARPHDIPSHPDQMYKSSGWTSYGDFLGYADGQGARGVFHSFEDARTFVCTLGLKSVKEWEAWRKSGARPHDIPSHPERTYKSSGWTSYGDFLGYADGQGARGSFRSFEDARTFVCTLGLKSKKEWQAWRKSDARSHDIPSTPERTYKSSGWTSYGDFLGFAVGKVAGSFRTFEDARAYVRKLGLKSKEDWQAWMKSGARPHDIPGNPHTVYKSSGWMSFGDFLGYDVGKVANTLKRKARA